MATALYSASDERKAANARYATSEKGRATLTRYQTTEKGKATFARYATSEKGRATLRRYRETQKGKRAVRQICRRRRARKLGADGNHTFAEFLTLCRTVGFRCLACGEKKPLTEDHIIPLLLGGSDDISNIQPLCQSCNSSKGTKTTDYRRAVFNIVPMYEQASLWASEASGFE